MKAFHVLLMIVTTVVWGVNFVATRVVLEVFSAEQVALARAVVTLAILWPFWQPRRGLSLPLVLSSLAIGTVSFYFLYAAIDLTESLTTVAVATQLMPPFAALLAMLFYKEIISGRQWGGIVIAFAGAVYLAGITESALSLSALGLTVLSVLAYAAGSTVVGKSPSVGVWRMLAWISAVSLIPLGLLAISAGSLMPDPAVVESRHWMALVFVIVISALLGQAVLFRMYRQYPVSVVAPWVLLVPLFAGFSSIMYYGEQVTASLWTGGVLVILGVWLQYRSGGQGEPSPAGRANT